MLTLSPYLYKPQWIYLRHNSTTTANIQMFGLVVLLALKLDTDGLVQLYGALNITSLSQHLTTYYQKQ